MSGVALPNFPGGGHIDLFGYACTNLTQRRKYTQKRERPGINHSGTVYADFKGAIGPTFERYLNSEFPS